MPTRPTIRRSCAGRNLAPRKGGIQREFPLSLGRRAALGDVPPVSKNRLGVAGRESLGGSAAGWVGPTNARNAGPSLPLAAAAARCGCRACPGEGRGLALPGCNLFPFVDFSPFSTQAVGPRSARALSDTTCFLFVDFSDAPQQGRRPTRPARAWQIRLVSLCRLVQRGSNPSCTASLQARRSRKKTRATIQFKSIP